MPNFLFYPEIPLSFQLETRLAEKEENLLEKDLVLEQVTRLAGRVRGKAETGKEDTLDLAKRVINLTHLCLMKFPTLINWTNPF